MGSKLQICRDRTVCAVLATGVVVSLTALTGGIAPALAAPGVPGGPGGPATPSTTVAPAPRAEAPAEAPEAPASKPTAADIPTAPAAPTVPQTVSAPVAPEPAATAEAPVQTRAPEPTTSAPEPVAPTRQTPTATTVVPSATREAPAPSSSPSSSTATSATAPAPTTSATQNREAAETPTSSAAPTTAADGSTPTSSVSAPTSSAGAPTGPTSPENGSPESPSPESSPAESSSAGSSPTSRDARSSETSSATSSESSSTPAAQRVIEKVAPQTLEAPEADVQIAQAAKIVEQKPAAAPAQEIADISRVLDVRGRDDRNNRQPFDPNFQNRDRDQVRPAGDNRWDRNVRQWRPDWVQYDEYYRPVLSNPYRDPVRIVYIYQNRPRIVNIPPLARIVLEVAQYAAYSFTAVVQNTVQQVANVAVGSFFGGGYFPGVGLPLPPPPPPLLNFANVPVQVRYSDATYEPFRVNKIVDVGDDRQLGERKVLLDGVTPAWGEWKQTPSGERSFEVHKTQQFPGLDDPQEAPLPGDYQLRLASDESPSGMNKRDVYLIAVAVACGALSIGAVVLAVFMGRRRRPQH